MHLLTLYEKGSENAVTHLIFKIVSANLHRYN